MTHQLLARVAAVVVLAVLPAYFASAGEPWSEATYLDGTIKDIPLNTSGKLNLTDPSALHFEYGGMDYAIPAGRIVGYRWDREVIGGFGEQVSEGVSKVGRAVLPMFFKDGKFLTVRFRNADDTATEIVVFSVPKELEPAADPLFATWVKKNLAVPAAAAAINEHDTWWGNRYWRTNRNRHLWAASEKSQPAEKPVDLAAREE
jgi:hypothetical protein